jgi:hypothetical protein
MTCVKEVNFMRLGGTKHDPLFSTYSPGEMPADLVASDPVWTRTGMVCGGLVYSESRQGG